MGGELGRGNEGARGSGRAEGIKEREEKERAQERACHGHLRPSTTQ